MITGILESLLIHILIPEVARIVREKPQSTDAEIIAEFNVRRQRIIDKGRTFLAETDPT